MNGDAKRAVRSVASRDDNKTRTLLEGLPCTVVKRFLYDDEARFSFTRSDQASQTCSALAEATGLTLHTSTICDGCACVGGNALYFDQQFAHTTCVELDPIRAACLRHNLLAANPLSFASNFSIIKKASPKVELFISFHHQRAWFDVLLD